MSELKLVIYDAVLNSRDKAVMLHVTCVDDYDVDEDAWFPRAMIFDDEGHEDLIAWDVGKVHKGKPMHTSGEFWTTEDLLEEKGLV